MRAPVTMPLAVPRPFRRSSKSRAFPTNRASSGVAGAFGVEEGLRLGPADLAERFGERAPHEGVRARPGRTQGAIVGGVVLELAERVGGAPHHAWIVVLEGAAQRFARARIRQPSKHVEQARFELGRGLR